jgi:hypothetical protein
MAKKCKARPNRSASAPKKSAAPFCRVEKFKDLGIFTYGRGDKPLVYLRLW